MCIGCGAKQPWVTEDRLNRGLVVVLPGIEGRDSGLADSIARGLDQGGVNWAIEIMDWASAWGPLYNLRAEERNHLKARQLSHRIRRYQIAYPDRPVVLVGQSGGGAIAVWTAEELTPRQSIKGILLINVALSRDYSLIRALEHTEEGIVSFYSPRDWMLLGVGTTVYGTMDGRHAVSAGMERFRVPTDRPRAYGKLFEIGWSKEMAKSGHPGLHLTSAAKDFVARYLAPLVLAETWTLQDVESLQKESPETTGTPTTAPGEEL
jgi:pimeloyl-ACP methyl ester carboxylesterase